MNKKPVPQPARALPPNFRPAMVRSPEPSTATARSRPERPGDPVEYNRWAIYGRKPRCGRVGQDDRHIQCPGADHHGPPAARPADDRHPVLLADIDLNIPARRPMPPAPRRTGAIPRTEDGPCPSFVGLDRAGPRRAPGSPRRSECQVQGGIETVITRSGGASRVPGVLNHQGLIPGPKLGPGISAGDCPDAESARSVRNPLPPGRPCGSRAGLLHVLERSLASFWFGSVLRRGVGQVPSRS